MAVWFRGALAALVLAAAVPAAAKAADPVAGDLVWLEQLAAKGDAEAWYRIGIIKEQGIGIPPDTAGAIEAYRQAAEAGHAEAQFRLAQLLDRSGGDPALARYWYQSAAAQGIAAAAFNAALYEETGTGGPVNLTAALDHYRQAAAGGIGQAAAQIALLYASGRLGEPDLVRALAWITKAVEMGTPGAAAIAKDLEATASAEERAAAAELAKSL